MSGTRSRCELAADLVAACVRAGTTHLFGVPGGGSNLDVVGAALAHGLSFVLTHGETAAAVMAGVMGELTGSPGLCVATRGPGAASAVNGVAQALLDRQPMLIVTDCVAQADRARVSHQRLDQQALMGPVTLASVVLDGRDDDAVGQAVHRTRCGRPGPVHVDLDPTSTPATGAAYPPDGLPEPTGLQPPGLEEPAGLEEAVSVVSGARRLVVVVGVGALARPPAERERLVATLAALGERTQTPVLCTYKARGFVPDDAPWCAGVATGASIEAPVLGDADVVLGIGLDPVELIPAAWRYGARAVLLGSWSVDDSTYLVPPSPGSAPLEVVGDLPALADAAAGAVTCAWPDGAGQTYRQVGQKALRAAVPASPRGLTPQEVVAIASRAAPPTTTATVDAGAHMLVAMTLWHVVEPARLLISSGLATMGFAVPAAIAAALARPGQPVVCFTGDGGLGMALAELETIARLELPVVVVVFNDALLSLIAAKQAPQGHGGAVAVTYRRTDFAAVAAACGIRSEQVGDAQEYAVSIARALRTGRPHLLDVQVDPTAYSAVLDEIRA